MTIKIEPNQAVALTYPERVLAKSPSTALDAEAVIALQESFPQLLATPSSGKGAYIPEWQDHGSNDPAAIRNWQTDPKCNSFLWVCKASHIAILDFDTKNLPDDVSPSTPSSERLMCAKLIADAWNLSEGKCFVSESGGLHFMFAAENPLPRAKLRQAPETGKYWLELLGDGGARAYSWHKVAAREGKLRPFPKEFIRMRTAPTPGDSRQNDIYGYSRLRTVNDMVEQLRKQTSSINEHLLRASRRLEFLGKLSPAAEARLAKAAQEAWNGRDEPGEIDATMDQGREYGRHARDEAEQRRDAIPDAVDIWPKGHLHWIAGGNGSTNKGMWREFVTGEGWHRPDLAHIQDRVYQSRANLLETSEGGQLSGPARASEVSACIGELRAKMSRMSRQDDWDCDPQWVADSTGRLLNLGLKSIDDLEMRDPDPGILVSRRLGFKVGKPSNEALNRAEMLMLQWANGDTQLANWLKTRYGYCLLPTNPERIFFWDWGTGKNGKSTCNDLFLSLFGEYGTSVSPAQFGKTNDENAEAKLLYKIAGKRLCLGSESGFKGEVNGSLIKRITGSKRASAKQLYADEADVAITAVPIFEANSLPNFREPNMQAIADRLKTIPWNARFDGEYVDPELPAWLQTDEAKTAFGWIMIRGLADYNQDGFLPCPLVDTESRRAIDNSLDTIERFMRECMTCVQDQPGYPSLSLARQHLPFKEIRVALSKWMEDNGYQTRFTTTSIEKALANRIPNNLLHPEDNTKPFSYLNVKGIWGWKLNSDLDTSSPPSDDNLTSPADSADPEHIPW